MITLLYKELNRADAMRSRPIRTLEATRDEVHVRKLVDASMFHGVLYEHTSNALEDVEVIYMEPSVDKQTLLPPHSIQTYGCTMEYYDISSGTSRFIHTERFADFHQMTTRLLDHYREIGGRDFELTYTILDEDRGVILAFVVPER